MTVIVIIVCAIFGLLMVGLSVRANARFIPLFSFSKPTYLPGSKAPSFFVGNHLTLPGTFGNIDYDFKDHGVITYHYSKAPNVYQVPSLRDFPLAIPAPSTILRIIPAL